MDTKVNYSYWVWMLLATILVASAMGLLSGNGTACQLVFVAGFLLAQFLVEEVRDK